MSEIFNSILQGINEAIEIQSQIVQIMKVTNMTQEDIVKLHDDGMEYDEILKMTLKGEEL